MRSRFITVVATAGMTLLGVAGAVPAQADTACTITNFSPRSVVVGLTPVTATFNVSTSGCTRQGWTVEDDGFEFYAYASSPQETFNPYSNGDAGPMDVIATAYNTSYATRERVFPNGFTLKRATTWQAGTFNAGPEPVVKGANVSLTGRLTIADWSNDRWGPYGGRPVDVQFRTPTGTYATVATATTDRNGWVKAAVRSSVSGYWRLRYAGNAAAGSSITAGDSVAVRG